MYLIITRVVNNMFRGDLIRGKFRVNNEYICSNQSFYACQCYDG